ncbi:hypothetical protein PC128_g6745 [Phytophthora cactorum]|nr:hypothetical protein PC128_g6745 [Phytophthora cactorum]
MQGCFSSLLRVRTALRVFKVGHGDKNEFAEGLKVLDDDEFWSQPKHTQRAKLYVQQLYDSFKVLPYSETLVALLEKRWADCEQPLFLLEYPLDPKRSDGMDELSVAIADKLGDFALLYYCKILDADASLIQGEMSE